MPYESHSAEIQQRLEAAIDAGLLAAAARLENAVKEEFNPPHYFTGWANEHGQLTGTLINSVTHTEPESDEGGRVIRVGSDVMYALYWEVGFHQRQWVWYDDQAGHFVSKPEPTRFVRYQKWEPAMRKSTYGMQQAFQRAFWRRLESR